MITKIEQLKQQVQTFTKKQFLSPIQQEAISARTDTAHYLWLLNILDPEKGERQFGLIDSYFKMTGSPDRGRFVYEWINVGENGEYPDYDQITYYNPEKHTGVNPRLDFDERSLFKALSGRAAKLRKLFWIKHIESLILQLDIDLAPWLPFIEDYTSMDIRQAIKDQSAENVDFGKFEKVEHELGRIKKVIEQWESQEQSTNREPVGVIPTDDDASNVQGMSWDVAQKKAENYISHKGFPGIVKLSKAVGCSQNTMRKAINDSPKLTKAEQEYKRQSNSVKGKVVTLTDKAIASIPSDKQDDPSIAADTEAILKKLVNESPPEKKPETRARIENMTPKQKQQLAKTYSEQYDDLHQDDPKKRQPRRRKL